MRNVVLCHLQSGGTFALGVSGKIQRRFTKLTSWRGYDVHYSMICKKWFFMVHPQFNIYDYMPQTKTLLVLSPYT